MASLGAAELIKLALILLYGAVGSGLCFPPCREAAAPFGSLGQTQTGPSEPAQGGAFAAFDTQSQKAYRTGADCHGWDEVDGTSVDIATATDKPFV